jgi:hypothetical protein
MSTINNNNNKEKKIEPTQGGNDDSPREGSSFELADLMAILNSIHQQVENQAADIAMLKVASLQSGDDPEDTLRESLADLYGTNSPKISKRLPPSSVSLLLFDST